MAQMVPTGVMDNPNPDLSHFAADSFDLSLLPPDECDLVPSPSAALPAILASCDSPPAFHAAAPTLRDLLLGFEDCDKITAQHRQQQQQPAPHQDNSPLPSHLEDCSLPIYLLREPPSTPERPSTASPVPSPVPLQNYSPLTPCPSQPSCSPRPPCSPPTTVDAANLRRLLQTERPETTEAKPEATPQDHRLLREVLRDTSFQRKYNLWPLGLPEVKVEAAEEEEEAVEPSNWSSAEVGSWLRWNLLHFSLPPDAIPEGAFSDLDGAALSALSEEEFVARASQCGATLHAQLEVWKAAACPKEENSMDWSCGSTGDASEEEEDTAMAPSTSQMEGSATPGTNRSGSHIHLWQFLKELLAQGNSYGACIRWLDRGRGVFKIEDSVRVARLWGRRKNRPAMNYDKLSRSIRQYYKKGIMRKTERSQRLVYQFCHPYCL
ncbi:hypothetical protein J437_LFUL001481 [Ladona fulva]|uniref:DNA-binding protein D-ETS-4 n=1 Tax=Ladona fulva TaxID=123851 RepID=A0A8K0NVR8_LADFU|nr:hypothetical protein J437_LFUL001481 [Ladona fulva]